MHICFLGGAENVTGSSHLIEAGDVRVLIDCGYYQERELIGRNWAPFSFDPATLTAVLLTHAHLDHCGLLPRLFKEGFKGPVYATAPSCEIAEIVMRDTAHIQAEDAAHKKERHEREGRVSPFGYEPLYTEDDVNHVVPALRHVTFGERFQICPGVVAQMQPAGHILGSASIRLEVTEGKTTRSIVFSGDIGRPNTPILQDPVPFVDADIVCVESTYGNRIHKKTSSINDALVRIIRTAVRAGGQVIIPSFAIERTQELLYRLGALMTDGSIPELPVFVDSPMATKVTAVFHKYPQLFDDEAQTRIRQGHPPCDFAQLRFTQSVEESKALKDLQGSAIIIAGSGMCTGGRIKHHLRNHLPRPESTVLFVGYQAVGTLGRQLLEGAYQVRLFGNMVDVHARIEKINGMSAHADQSELLAWLSALTRPPQQVYAIHGEKDACEGLCSAIRSELGWPCKTAGFAECEVIA